jgi:hypothetical protein
MLIENYYNVLKRKRRKSAWGYPALPGKRKGRKYIVFLSWRGPDLPPDVVRPKNRPGEYHSGPCCAILAGCFLQVFSTINKNAAKGEGV